MKNPVWKLALFVFMMYYMQGQLSAVRSFEEAYLGGRYGLTLLDFAESQNMFTAAWFIKPLHGWMTDNINLFGLGYRRPFCFIGTLVGGAAFVVMPNIAPVSDAGWATYLTVVFVRSFGIALADAATDALLVDADVGSLGAMFQGLMNSGRSFGEIVGSGLGGVVAGPNVDPSIFYFLGAGVFMATPFSFLVAEERHTKETFDWRGLHVFSTPVVIALNFWNILGQTGDRCATIVMTRWARVEHGFTGDQLGYMNSVSLVAAIAGCLAMGYLLDRGNRRALLLGESFIFVLSNIVQLTITTRDGVWAFWLFNAFASGLHITALNRMIFLVAPRQAPGVFLALCSMIGHAATMSGNTLGGWIGDTYGIRMAFIVGAVISASMMIPAFFLTSDSMDPVTARLAADAEEKRRALGFAPEGGEVDGDGNPVKLVVIKSPLEAGGGAGDDARRARVKELMVAGGDATDAAAALNEARVLAAVRAHAHGVK